MQMTFQINVIVVVKNIKLNNKGFERMKCPKCGEELEEIAIDYQYVCINKHRWIIQQI